MGRMKKLALLVSILVVVLVSAIFLFWVGERKHPKLGKVVIGVYPADFSLLLAIAKDMGFFGKYGLEVDFKEYPIDWAALQGFLRGESEVVTVAESAFVSNSFENREMRILASIATADMVEVIARRDRGITRPADLKGKRVGVAMRTSAGFFFTSFLILNRLSLADVKLVEIPPEKWVESIIRGAVDAIVAWDQYAYEIRQGLGENGVTWSAQNRQNFYWLLVSNRAWIEEHPGQVESLLKALLDAEEYVRTDPGRAKQFLLKRWPRDSAYVQNAWSRMEFAVSLDQSLLTVMDEEARWNIETGLTEQKEIPNYLRYLHLKALEAVKPEAVTILR